MEGIAQTRHYHYPCVCLCVTLGPIVSRFDGCEVMRRCSDRPSVM